MIPEMPLKKSALHAASATVALQEAPLEASAPCRVDSGGTWDIKALSLPLAAVLPVTVNVALDLRTRVRLLPCEEGWVRISSKGFGSGGRAFRFEELPFGPPFGLFFAAVARFGFSGLEIHIESGSPVRSALGGSSTALTALIRALSLLRERLGGKKMPPREILALGYQLEDGISGGFCGMQDQAAAVYGGVHLWHWQYGRPGPPYARERLLDAGGCRELTQRMLVAHSGLEHDSGSVNRGWVLDFLSCKTREGWVEANRVVRDFAEALKNRNWKGAASAMKREMAVRRKITPGALVPETRELIYAAEEAGCGARFTGAGAGGAVWALGPLDHIQDLRRGWEKILSPFPGGGILDCQVDTKGVLP